MAATLAPTILSLEENANSAIRLSAENMVAPMPK
jgi:hypothetical protein